MECASCDTKFNKSYQNTISPELMTYPKKEFIEDFICCICLNIPLNPKKCNKCLHIFCEDCFNNAGKYPYRCIDSELIDIDRLNKNILNKCIFMCPFSEKGICQKELKFDEIKTHLGNHKNNNIIELDKYSKYIKKERFNQKQIEIGKKYLVEQQNKMNEIKDKYSSDQFMNIFLNYCKMKLTLLFTDGIFPDNKDLLNDIVKEKEYVRKVISNIQDKLYNQNLNYVISLLKGQIKISEYSSLKLTNEETLALISMIKAELKFVNTRGFKEIPQNDFIDYFGKDAEKNIYLFRKSLEKKYLFNNE